MTHEIQRHWFPIALGIGVSALLTAPVVAQLVDKTQTFQVVEGIALSLIDEIGFGRGDVMTPDSSSFVIGRDPFRAIRRGRQLFQRKFTRMQGQGPGVGDGSGDIATTNEIGAGLADSCAACHGRPRGAAGFGGDVATRPDSRDAPHLFGLGLKEMLADEITADLRAARSTAIARAVSGHHPVTAALTSKGIHYGSIAAYPDGRVDASNVQGVDADLRVRPFFAHGKTISIREFVVGALNAEMGLQSVDPDLASAHAGGRVVTPAGMVLDGSRDAIDAPPPEPNRNDIPQSLVDFWEFYLLNYFKPATYKQTPAARSGRQLFETIGCTRCHIPSLTINRDRRVADVETVYDPVHGIMNNLFATAIPLARIVDDGVGLPPLKLPALGRFVVKNIYTDFKRHDLGPNFHERNYDGTLRTEFLTTPLWGVGSTAPYGHDGRSINLTEVILRHGGDAQDERDHFAELEPPGRAAVLDFLNALVLFPPDDTASNLDPGNPSTPGFPQFGHGSIRLTVLFNDPTRKE